MACIGIDSTCQNSQSEGFQVARASKQYVFAESGEQYLDCMNGSAHVGHTHPQVPVINLTLGHPTLYVIWDRDIKLFDTVA